LGSLHPIGLSNRPAARRLRPRKTPGHRQPHPAVGRAGRARPLLGHRHDGLRSDRSLLGRGLRAAGRL